MGITGMWDYMQKFAISTNLSTLRNKRIAIDGHCWLNEVVRGSVAHSSTTRFFHLGTFYTRCKSLMERGIEPVVVFDGIVDAAQSSAECSMPVKKDRKRGTGIWASELRYELIRKVEEIKELLNAMGVRWMNSKLEGEAQCAQLEQRGLVNGCITRELDYILFGGNNLYQVEFDSNGELLSDEVSCISMDHIAEKLCVSRACLIAMAVMMGCDYFQKGIPGVGLVTSLEIVSEFYLMSHDHPQVILDRFKSYATELLSARDYDSLGKRKLKASVARNAIDLRAFNPNSDVIAEAINAYLTPYTINYSRNQLPKKLPLDDEYVQRILVRDGSWNSSRGKPKNEKLAKKEGMDKLNAKCSLHGTVGKEEKMYCSKRELAAIERLQYTATFYKHNSVIEVLSLSCSPDETDNHCVATGKQDNQLRGARRKGNPNANGQVEAPKRARMKQSATAAPPAVAMANNIKNNNVGNNNKGSAHVQMQNGQKTTADHSSSANDIVIIDDVAHPNALHVIQSRA